MITRNFICVIILKTVVKLENFLVRTSTTPKDAQNPKFDRTEIIWLPLDSARIIQKLYEIRNGIA